MRGGVIMIRAVAALDMSKIQVYLVRKNLYIQMNYFIYLVHLKRTECVMSNLRSETTHSRSVFFFVQDQMCCV